MSGTKKPTMSKLEQAPIWQLAASIVPRVRKIIKDVAYQEYYVFASPALQAAVSLNSDVALIVGKDVEASLFDYCYARGHLFTLRGLLLTGEQAGSLSRDAVLLTELDKMQALLEKGITALEAAEAKREKEGKA